MTGYNFKGNNSASLSFASFLNATSSERTKRWKVTGNSISSIHLYYIIYVYFLCKILTLPWLLLVKVMSVHLCFSAIFKSGEQFL